VSHQKLKVSDIAMRQITALWLSRKLGILTKIQTTASISICFASSLSNVELTMQLSRCFFIEFRTSVIISACSMEKDRSAETFATGTKSVAEDVLDLENPLAASAVKLHQGFTLA
jgi:hypothetical protein